MEEAIKLLKQLGLSDYEARAYTTLLSVGPATAEEVSKISGIPYSKIYNVFSRLEARGWLEIQGSRPARYSAKPPSEVMDLLISEEEKRMKKLVEAAVPLLESIYMRKVEIRKPDVWVIRGLTHVLKRAVEMIGKAESEILISLPYLPTQAKELPSLLSIQKAKGVSVRILTTESLKLKVHGIKVKRRKNLFGGGIIIDGKEVLLILGRQDEVIGIWSNEPGLAQFAEEYFNYLWGR